MHAGPLTMYIRAYTPQKGHDDGARSGRACVGPMKNCRRIARARKRTERTRASTFSARLRCGSSCSRNKNLPASVARRKWINIIEPSGESIVVAEINWPRDFAIVSLRDIYVYGVSLFSILGLAMCVCEFECVVISTRGEIFNG